MIIEDFTIPSAVLLSLVFLKVRYTKVHYIAISILACGISIGFINDFFHLQGGDSKILGDAMALVGAFFYALENVLQEHLLKKPEDIFNFLGFIGLFGVVITLAGACCVWEFD